MVKMSIKELASDLTSDEILEIEKAAEKEPVFDVDSPEMTSDMLKQFKRMSQKQRIKQTASIRLSAKAQEFSKKYGKGYTSFFSRLIDAALDDESLVRKCI